MNIYPFIWAIGFFFASLQLAMANQPKQPCKIFVDGECRAG
jgi:hypothetical protein